MSTNEGRGLGRQNLGGAFGRRTEGLSKKLAPLSTPTTPDSEGTAAEAPPTPAQSGKTATSKSRSSAGEKSPKPARSRNQPAPRDRSTMGEKDQPQPKSSNRALYLAPEIRNQLRDEGTTTHRSYTEIVLDAIETTYDELVDQYTARNSPRRSLFSRPTTTRRRHDDVDRVQVTVRLTLDNEEVLDRLVEEVGAPNRSDFVEQALRLYFERSTNS